LSAVRADRRVSAPTISSAIALPRSHCTAMRFFFPNRRQVASLPLTLRALLPISSSSELKGMGSASPPAGGKLHPSRQLPNTPSRVLRKKGEQHGYPKSVSSAGPAGDAGCSCSRVGGHPRLRRAGPGEKGRSERRVLREQHASRSSRHEGVSGHALPRTLDRVAGLLQAQQNGKDPLQAVPGLSLPFSILSFV
jgi:hypothetical protein